MTQLAAPSIRESDLVPQPQIGPDVYFVKYQGHEGKWLEVLPDGSLAMSTAPNGQYQEWRKAGGKVYVQAGGDAGYQTGSCALPLIEGA